MGIENIYSSCHITNVFIKSYQVVLFMLPECDCVDSVYDDDNDNDDYDNDDVNGEPIMTDMHNVAVQ